jgi:hypothetical protein
VTPSLDAPTASGDAAAAPALADLALNAPSTSARSLPPASPAVASTALGAKIDTTSQSSGIAAGALSSPAPSATSPKSIGIAAASSSQTASVRRTAVVDGLLSDLSADWLDE